MKKTLLFASLLAVGFSVNAQKIADGANAPEVSGLRVISVDNTTDEVTYGEQISLQAYLDAGKTVVMDGSATWCAPCWSVHKAKILDDLYTAYGPEASDELRVLFVEADPSTAVSELGGKNQAPLLGMPERGNPQGNWLTDVPYPVIDSDVLSKSVANGGYGLNAFPTMYVIVPSGTIGQPGKVYNLTIDSLDKMVTAINTAKQSDLVGVDHWAKVLGQDIRYCDAAPTVSAYVQGYGHALTNVKAELKKGDDVVATETFTLDLDAFELGEITFTGITTENDAAYSVSLVEVNGAAALTTIPENNITEFKGAEAEQSYKNVKITIHTDEYPEEMRFYIVYGEPDAQGNVSVKYALTPFTATAANREKTFVYYTTLDGNECYSVVLQDAAGDGWDYNSAGGEVPHGVKIESNDVIVFEHNGTFDQQVWINSSFKTNDILDTEKFANATFAIYPNPSNGIFNFSTQESVDVTVVDITGKTVHTATGINDGGSINLSGLQTGMYIAKIKAASGERIEKLLIK